MFNPSGKTNHVGGIQSTTKIEKRDDKTSSESSTKIPNEKPLIGSFEAASRQNSDPAFKREVTIGTSGVSDGKPSPKIFPTKLKIMPDKRDEKSFDPDAFKEFTKRMRGLQGDRLKDINEARNICNPRDLKIDSTTRTGIEAEEALIISSYKKDGLGIRQEYTRYAGRFGFACLDLFERQRIKPPSLNLVQIAGGGDEFEKFKERSAPELAKLKSVVSEVQAIWKEPFSYTDDFGVRQELPLPMQQEGEVISAYIGKVFEKAIEEAVIRFSSPEDEESE